MCQWWWCWKICIFESIVEYLFGYHSIYWITVQFVKRWRFRFSSERLVYDGARLLEAWSTLPMEETLLKCCWSHNIDQMVQCRGSSCSLAQYRPHLYTSIPADNFENWSLFNWQIFAELHRCYSIESEKDDPTLSPFFAHGSPPSGCRLSVDTVLGCCNRLK